MTVRVHAEHDCLHSLDTDEQQSHLHTPLCCATLLQARAFVTTQPLADTMG
jgi:hypothetical protein